MLTIDVCIASYNTKAATELTIRSARRRAGIDARLVVGDGASTDGTLTMLEALERDGAISIERWPGRRFHKDWLDHWYGTSDADYLVFSDSDVFYRRNGWLRDLVDTAEREGAALVAARIQPDWSQRPRWADGTATTLPGERPEPCLMLLDLRQLRGVVAASFAYHEEPLVDRPGQKLGYDVGGAFMREAKRAGLVCMAMPAGYMSSYRHWGGLTWKQASSGGLELRTRARQLAKTILLRALLVSARLREHDRRTHAGTHGGPR